LNAVLTSLLYTRNPVEEFVLVDPKKGGTDTFNKIEKTLFRTSDSEDAILTDNAKVVNTLNLVMRRNGQPLLFVERCNGAKHKRIQRQI
jgi:hypothetical protein